MAKQKATRLSENFYKLIYVYYFACRSQFYLFYCQAHAYMLLELYIRWNIMNALLPFDQRDGFLWYNGEIKPWQDGRVHIMTHGLHYGSCVFEGIRTYGGKIYQLQEHMQRLIDSAKLLGMTLPYTCAQLEEATTQVIVAQQLSNAYIRPLAWRGSERMVIGARNSIHVAIIAWDFPASRLEAASKGIRLHWSRWRRPSPECAPTASKAAGLYMIATMTKHEAEDAGFDDGLMLDYRGYIAETHAANVFFVLDDQLHTPLADCFLNGLTRQTVIALAKEAGITMVERHLLPEDITDASECFITGTAAGLTPVTEIAGHTMPIGPITKQLQTLFATHINTACNM
jgi:branched-chain amino acid aminotransferase